MMVKLVDRQPATVKDRLPSSGLYLDAHPCFEYFPPGSTYNPETGMFDCEICIPVASL